MKKISLFLLAMSLAGVTLAQTTFQTVTVSPNNYTTNKLWIGTQPVSGVVENALNVYGRIKFLGVDTAFRMGTDGQQSNIYRSSPGGSVYPFNNYDNLLVQAGTTVGSTNHGSDIVFVTGSTPKVAMIVSGNGNIGLGTPSPNSKLDVKGNIQLDGGNFFGVSLTDTFTVTTISGAHHPQPHYGMQWVPDDWNVSGNTLWLASYGGMKFFSRGLTRFAINGNSGYVGINTASPQSELSVNGTITTKKIKVTQTNWADFVFEKNYTLPSLHTVESYIKANNHLPDVPSAAEVEKDGQDLAEMNKVLLKKVEELTLYAIAQQKQAAAQQKEIDELKAAVARLSK